MKPRKNYEEEAQKLSQAIDIAIESYKTVPPKLWNSSHVELFTNHLIQQKQNVLFPEPRYKSLASLKYSIEDVFTYFQESSGETVEYFWEKIIASNLDYQRVNKLEKILKRGKIKGRLEYEYVKDIILVAQQTGMISQEESKQLSEMLEKYESK